jgi:CrcB protein
VNASEVAAVAIAGGIGAGLRFLVDRLVMRRRHPDRFPLGILIVNVTGSFALGMLVGSGTAFMPGALATIVGTGLLGGYTTFSTVSVETVLLAERGLRSRAAANVIGTVALAVLAASLGVATGTALAG